MMGNKTPKFDISFAVQQSNSNNSESVKHTDLEIRKPYI